MRKSLGIFHDCLINFIKVVIEVNNKLMLSCAIKLIPVLVEIVYGATLSFLLVIIGLGTSTFLSTPTLLVAGYHLSNMSVPLFHTSLNRVDEHLNLLYAFKGDLLGYWDSLVVLVQTFFSSV